ncbi:hypothetical protein [uncultured Helicobacter sp.]|uniref:hypothetical protein n=1 Tax=uncultured Helicobacter sp. TaxID=175537 RepID=UPI00374EFE42
MKQLVRVLLVFCLCVVSFVSAKDYSEEYRFGIGGLYGTRDLAPDNNVTNVGGVLVLSSDGVYKRFKLAPTIMLGAGDSSRHNAPFVFYDFLVKVGLNIASYEHPLYINVGIGSTQLYDDTRDDTFKVRTTEYLAGLEGIIKKSEKLRYEYSADYHYVGAGSYGGIRISDNGSYGIRASLGFSYQLGEKLFYYVKLRAKYQNITYNPSLPTAQNLVGMVEIGLGGR